MFTNIITTKLDTMTVNYFDCCSYQGQFNLTDYISDQFQNDIDNNHIETKEGFEIDWEWTKDWGSNVIASFNNAFEIEKIKGLTIKAIGIDSPKYYNYRGEELVLDVIATKEFKTSLNANLDSVEFQNWLKENYSSRSGFMSFVPTNILEFIESDYCFDLLLNYYFTVLNADVLKDINERAFDDFMSNGGFNNSYDLIYKAI